MDSERRVDNHTAGSRDIAVVEPYAKPRLLRLSVDQTMGGMDGQDEPGSNMAAGWETKGPS